MNVVSRGIKNAVRSPMRSVAIVVMLAISIGLIMSMLVARSSVEAKIVEVKATAGTKITINPAGIQGFAGGGNALSADNLETIASTSHVASIVASLSDQLGTDDTNLESSLEMGSFGQRMMRFEESGENSTDQKVPSNGTGDDNATRPAITPRITVTGTTDANSASSDGDELTIISGKSFSGDSSDFVALIGKDLAEKNSLEIGSTFTAYDTTITVSGIFETGNTFQDSNVIMPLATLQSLTNQDGAISSIVATVDSSDNVEGTVSALEESLGDDADITSQVEQAEASVSSLESISSLALAGVIGATVAGAVIVLLAMVMVVRERRREIGVIKAIGGSNQKVMIQFAAEALTLTVIGAVVGLGLGIAVSGPMTNSLVSSQNSSASTPSIGVRTGTFSGGSGGMMQRGMQLLGNNITSVTSSVTPQVFAVAVVITLLIAVAGSAIPAWFISKIKPAEVLRTE